MRPLSFPSARAFGALVAVVLGAILVFNTFAIISAGYIGVANLFGKVSDRTLGADTNAKFPLALVVRMSVNTQEIREVMQVLSTEGHSVHLEVSVLYLLDPSKAADVYRTIAPNYRQSCERVVDIVEVAVESEVKAKAFYTRAARIANRGESQMVFLELTEMEDGHAKLLVDRFGSLLYADGTEPRPFLQRLEDMVVNMPAGEEYALIERGEMRLVIEFAIGMEARARDAYRALGAQLTDPDLQALCRDLAQEEQKHHDTLRSMRVSVDAEIEDRPAL